MARRTARQRAASRRNLEKARRKRRRRIAIGVTAVAMGAATGAYAVDRSRHKTLHHSTSRAAAHSIVKTQRFKPHSTEGDKIYFTTKRQYEYGHHSVKVRVKKKTYRNIAKTDKTQSNAVYIHGQQIRNHNLKIRMGRSASKMERRRPVNPYRPDGSR